MNGNENELEKSEESTDFYPNLCSLELHGRIIQANRKTWRKTIREITDTCCARRGDDFCPLGNFF